MKRTLTFFCLIGSLLIFLDTVNAADSLLLLLFAGVVPGTDLRIAPIDMMAAIATAITVVILRITVWPRFRNLLIVEPIKPVKAKRTARRAA